MKTKKHFIEVEIPTGKYCDGCQFYRPTDDGYFASCDFWGYFMNCMKIGGNLRHEECIGKFGMVENSMRNPEKKENEI